MITSILEVLGGFIVRTIESLGYPGIILLMGIESACIPLPSEVIMPFSGYLVGKGRFTLWGVGNAGAIGCVAGSLVAYFAGGWMGRPVIERWGKWVLIGRHELDMADRWFARWGGAAVFWARLLPVVRTFIAFPAGVARMPLGRFVLYTYLGSLPWCLALGYAGLLLGERWPVLRNTFHKFDAALGILIALGAALWIWRHFSNRSAPSPSDKS